MRKLIIFSSLIILIINVKLFTIATGLLSSSSDIAVMAGAVLITLIIIGNYYLIKLFRKGKKV